MCTTCYFKVNNFFRTMKNSWSYTLYIHKHLVFGHGDIAKFTFKVYLIESFTLEYFFSSWAYTYVLGKLKVTQTRQHW